MNGGPWSEPLIAGETVILFGADILLWITAPVLQPIRKSSGFPTNPSLLQWLWIYSLHTPPAVNLFPFASDFWQNSLALICGGESIRTLQRSWPALNHLSVGVEPTSPSGCTRSGHRGWGSKHQRWSWDTAEWVGEKSWPPSSSSLRPDRKQDRKERKFI